MRHYRTEALVIAKEFKDRGIPLIREALTQFFITNPYVYALAFRIDWNKQGDYSEYSKIYDFRAKLEPNVPGLGNDLNNFVEVSMIHDRTNLRDNVGTIALMLRELRPSALELFHVGFNILDREDWLPNIEFDKAEPPSSLCPPIKYSM